MASGTARGDLLDQVEGYLNRCLEAATRGQIRDDETAALLARVRRATGTERKERLEGLQRAGTWRPGYDDLLPSADPWWVDVLGIGAALLIWLLPGIGLCLLAQWVWR